MKRAELVRLARVGAEARLEALLREIDVILSQFPDLRRPGWRRVLETPQAAERIPQPAVKKRRLRGGLSAAGRRAIRLAQRKRWAEWKAKQGKSATETERQSSPPKSRSGGRARKKR